MWPSRLTSSRWSPLRSSTSSAKPTRVRGHVTTDGLAPSHPTPVHINAPSLTRPLLALCLCESPDHWNCLHLHLHPQQFVKFLLHEQDRNRQSSLVSSQHPPSSSFPRLPSPLPTHLPCSFFPSIWQACMKASGCQMARRAGSLSATSSRSLMST